MARPRKIKEEFNPSVSLVSYNFKDKIVESSIYNREALKMILEIPAMDDDQLKQMFTSTNEARRLMFVFNGAISYEIYKRACDRGETFTTKKGMGITELFRDLSVSSGLDPSTLRDDFKIYDEFGVMLLDLLASFPERILPREYYLLATKTPSPRATLEYFEEKRDSVTYYVIHARRDAKRFNQGMNVEEVNKLDLLEREAAVERIRELTTSSESLEEAPSAPLIPVSRERTVTVALPDSEETVRYINLIMDKYGSVREWFIRRAMEEFGE